MTTAVDRPDYRSLHARRRRRRRRGADTFALRRHRRSRGGVQGQENEQRLDLEAEPAARGEHPCDGRSLELKIT